MIDAVRAEALKMARHRGTWLMVWIYPIGVALIVVGTLIYTMFAGASDEAPGSAAQWIRDTTLFWHAPGSGPGRILLASFTALVFAGEYGWNTWKLVVPSSRRSELIAAKWLIVIAFTLMALTATQIVTFVGIGIEAAQGTRIPDDVTFGAVMTAQVRAAAYSLVPIIYAVSFAGMFAVLTRSILATVVLSIALVIVESSLPLLGLFFYARAPGLTEFLIQATPPFHVENLTEWAFYERPYSLVLSLERALETGWGTSLAMVLGWSALAAVVTLASFKRQDMN